MSELKACPFCGGEAVIQKDDGGDNSQNWSYDIFCSEDECGCCFVAEFREPRDKIIKAWNARA